MNSVAIAPAFIHASVKRRKNTWYSIGDGNWTDKNIWLSNSVKRWDYPGQINIPVPKFPQIGDDVYINHTVACNLTAVINNLYISGSLTSTTNSISLTVNGDLQCTGSISFSSSINLILYGVNNFVVSFTSGASSTVTYTRPGDQYIMGLTYRNLITANNIGTKYVLAALDALGTFTVNANTTLQANTTLTGNFTLSANVFEAATYNFTVTGNTVLSNPVTFSKTGSGNILFIGSFSTGSGAGGKLNLSGNPDVEFRGGWTSFQYYSGGSFNTGTGTWKFSTNNQSLTNGFVTSTFTCNILISGIITVTNNFQLNQTGGIRLGPSSTLNGDNAASKWLNQSYIFFSNTSATLPMATGIFDHTTAANSYVGYNMNSSYTLPFTAYRNLNVDGTGIKTLSGDTIISANLTVQASSSVELSSFAFTVNGIASILGKISKSSSSAGNILFIGAFASGANGALDFSGNPNVEIRGGFTFINSISFGALFNSGTGTWSFTTNNQSLVLGQTALTFTAAVLISGAITVTLNPSAPAGDAIFTNTINGNNAASTLDNRLTGTGSLQYQNAQRPMLTGILQTNAAANIFVYNAAGAQDIKGGPSTGAKQIYRTLTLAGSGIKSLQGYVSVINTFTLTAPATKNDNGFSLTNP